MTGTPHDVAARLLAAHQAAIEALGQSISYPRPRTAEHKRRDKLGYQRAQDTWHRLTTYIAANQAELGDIEPWSNLNTVQAPDDPLDIIVAQIVARGFSPDYVMYRAYLAAGRTTPRMQDYHAAIGAPLWANTR